MKIVGCFPSLEFKLAWGFKLNVWKSNQAWYSNTNTSLLEFSISVWHSSIFNEPLTGWLEISSWLIFHSNTLIVVFQMIIQLQDIWCWPTSHTIWPIWPVQRMGNFRQFFGLTYRKDNVTQHHYFSLTMNQSLFYGPMTHSGVLSLSNTNVLNSLKYSIQSGRQPFCETCLISTSLRISSNRGSEFFAAYTYSLTVISTWN